MRMPDATPLEIKMAKTRRTFLKLLSATIAVLPLGSRLASARAAGPRFHMVNGWILTDADVAALRKMGL